MHQKMDKNVKVNLSLSISKHCTMQIYGGVDISMLASEVDPRSHLDMVENLSTMFLNQTGDKSSTAQSTVIILT
jgi:hypothetical protein